MTVIAAVIMSMSPGTARVPETSVEINGVAVKVMINTNYVEFYIEVVASKGR